MGSALAERPASSSVTQPLTDKQQAFLAAYLGPARLNATEAARQAGYSGDQDTLTSVASENLRKPYIRERIREALAERAAPPEEVIARATELARASIANLIEIDPDDPSKWTLNLKKAEENGSLYTIDTLKDGKYGTELKLQSRLDALEVLARAHKLYGEQTVNVNVGLPEDAQGKLARHAEIAIRMLKDLVEAGKIDLPQLLGQTIEQFPHLAETLMMARPIEGSFKEDQAESGESGFVGTPYTGHSESGGMIARPSEEPVTEVMEVYVPRRRRTS